MPIQRLIWSRSTRTVVTSSRRDPQMIIEGATFQPGLGDAMPGPLGDRGRNQYIGIEDGSHRSGSGPTPSAAPKLRDFLGREANGIVLAQPVTRRLEDPPNVTGVVLPRRLP